MKTGRILPAAIAICLLAASCKPRSGDTDAPKTAEPGLSGRYVNQTFLDEMADSLGFTPRYYCLQMHFVDSHRVFIDRGFEGDTLEYKSEGESFKLANASSLGDMTFTIGEQGRLFLNDSAFNGTPRLSSFTRLEDGRDAAKEWTRMVNERMVSGDYGLFEKEKATGIKVSLGADGSVRGLSDYVSYELCHTGDCLQTTVPYSHIVFLTKADGSRDTFAYTFEKGKTGMKIFGVGKPIPDTKGERKILALVYDLRKI